MTFFADYRKCITFAVAFKNCFRGVAQLVAHLVWDQRVVSSSLATPTSPSKVMLRHYDGGLFLLEGFVGQSPTIR